MALHSIPIAPNNGWLLRHLTTLFYSACRTHPVMAEFLSGTLKDIGDKFSVKYGGDILINVDAGNVKVDPQTAKKVCEAAKSTGFKANWKSGDGRELLIDISTDSMIVERLGTTTITLGALYVGYEVGKRLIDFVIRKALGEGVKDTTPGFLQPQLHCSTDKRFLEVLTDYESGNMKERLKEEFSQAGIKVKGLKVEIENKEEVNEKKEAIKKRYYRYLIKI